MIRKHAYTVALDSALVERPGPGLAPTAFRIWAAGQNDSDDGPVFFTEGAAQRLMEEQAARGRVYSSDFDHLSLMADRPATSGRASGWHRLETRKDAAGALELWAVDIEWCADAKAGLEASPPQWRYFSPAFETDEKGEVTSYINFALCINPLTHNLPSLMAESGSDNPLMGVQEVRKRDMDKHAIASAWGKICAEGTPDEERKEAMALLNQHFAQLAEETPEPGQGNTEGEKKDPPKVQSEKPEMYGGDEDKERKAAQGGDKDPGNKWPSNGEAPATEKTEVRAAAAVGTDLLRANARIDALEIEALLSRHTELPESLRIWCATQKPDVVKSFLASKPRFEGKRNAAPVQGGETSDGPAPVGLQGAELDEINKGMGIVPKMSTPFVRVPVRDGGGLRIHTIRPSEARMANARGNK